MGRMDEPMQMIAIMQEFGWSFEEYQNTPSFVLTLVKEKMRRDRKRQELENKSHRRGL